MSTINKTINQNLTLGSVNSYPTYASPLTITTTGAVVAAGYGSAAIYGPASQAWTVDNQGTITNTGGNDGVDLFGGGSVTNGAGGATAALIHGDWGIFIVGGGSVANNAGLIEGYNAGVYISGAAMVTNSGTILATGTGVNLLVGGSVANNAGLIEGQTGVDISGFSAGGAGTVTNSATIITNGLAGKAGYGIHLGAGGSVGNNAGLIEGPIGVCITGAAGMVTNSGTIAGMGTLPVLGGYFFAGGAGLGVYLLGGGTVIDSGTISGDNGTAVSFGGTGGNLLVLEHSYRLNGVVIGSASATNTVQLAGSVGAAVTVGYTGLGLAHFQNVLFGTGGDDTLKVAANSGTLPATISGFTLTSDIVDLTGLAGGTIGGGGTVNGSDQLVVSNGSQTETLQLDAGENYTGLTFPTASDGSGGTDILVACFCRGTLILSERGEVTVEDLAIGDKVATLSGEAKPIKWIGRRSYAARFIRGNRAVLPIRVEAGALAHGVPARDLFVSPEHALYIDGVLVPARQLVNGATITLPEAVEQIDYFHIELDVHDIIFAEGAPAETFVDCDNRGMFHNAGEFPALYPGDERPAWDFCAPRLGEGSAELAAIRAALFDRAEALGHRLTGDPDLHLIVDGENVWGQAGVEEEVYRFTIPAGGRAVWLASRSAVPAEVEAASQDRRRLGVPLKRIVLHGAGRCNEIGHGHSSLRQGFHEDEGGHRWTDGSARLPDELLRPFAGEVTIEVHLIRPGLRYPLDAAVPTAAAA